MWAFYQLMVCLVFFCRNTQRLYNFHSNETEPDVHRGGSQWVCQHSAARQRIQYTVWSKMNWPCKNTSMLLWTFKTSFRYNTFCYPLHASHTLCFKCHCTHLMICLPLQKALWSAAHYSVLLWCSVYCIAFVTQCCTHSDPWSAEFSTSLYTF